MRGRVEGREAEVTRIPTNMIPLEPIQWHLDTGAHDRCPCCLSRTMVRMAPRKRQCNTCMSLWEIHVSPETWLKLIGVLKKEKHPCVVCHRVMQEKIEWMAPVQWTCGQCAPTQDVPPPQ